MGSLATGSSLLTKEARKLHLSPTLHINELVQERLNKGKRVLHLGFGEATFPIQEDVLEAHRQTSQNTSYLPVAGLMKLREVRIIPKYFSNLTLLTHSVARIPISISPPGHYY